jgi:hypothetical protein
MGKGKLLAITLILIMGGIGTYGGILYNAATKLETIGDPRITNVNINIGLFVWNSITIAFEVDIFSPTGIEVKIDGGLFDVSINGSYVGSGQFNAFIAKKTPSIIPGSLTINRANVDSATSNVLFNFLLGSGNILIEITINQVTIYGIEIGLELNQSIIITHESLTAKN